MDEAAIFDGLNPEQRRAVETVRGPVCILAGAGSGKTTTITRRDREPGRDGRVPGRRRSWPSRSRTRRRARCAGRLGQLGVSGVAARTFHCGRARAAALLPPGRAARRSSSSKVLALRNIAQRPAGRATASGPRGDLATEIEWAKSAPGHAARPTSRRSASTRRRSRPTSCSGSSARYERLEARGGPDRLRGPARADDPPARRGRARAGDGARALPRVHGRRVPGRQPAPAGAARPLARPAPTSCARSATTTRRSTGSPARRRRFLLALPQRFPHATVVRLEANYRSTPQVLELANRLVPQLGGAEKTLRATRPDGPEPELRPFAAPEDEAAYVVARVRELGRGRRARGDRRAAAHERPLGRLRGGVPRGRPAVPGRVAACARRRSPALEGSRGAARARWRRPSQSRGPRSRASSIPFRTGSASES